MNVQCIVHLHVPDLLAGVDDDVVALPVDLNGAALALVDIPDTQIRLYTYRLSSNLHRLVRLGVIDDDVGLVLEELHDPLLPVQLEPAGLVPHHGLDGGKTTIVF